MANQWSSRRWGASIYTGLTLDVSASSTLDASGSALVVAPATHAVAASSALALTAYASPVVNLGRRQKGQTITFAVDTLGTPDNPPIASVVGPDNALFGAFDLPLVVQSNQFGRSVLLAGALALGTFLVTYTWTLAGAPQSMVEKFDLVGGGDSGGGVIALCYYERPEARYLLAQLAAGKLVQGRNPKF